MNWLIDFVIICMREGVYYEEGDLLSAFKL